MQKYVKYTNMRYYVDPDVGLLATNGDELPRKMERKSPMVYIDWYRGLDWYDEGVVVQDTLGTLGAREEYFYGFYSRLVDGNPLNRHPDNFIVKTGHWFKGKVEISLGRCPHCNK